MRVVISGAEDPTMGLRAWSEALGLDGHGHPLRTRPEARHWHFRKGKLPGTVEITFEAGELVIEVRANRKGPWTDAAVSDLRARLG
jgi:hypothetical protein